MLFFVDLTFNCHMLTPSKLLCTVLWNRLYHLLDGSLLLALPRSVRFRSGCRQDLEKVFLYELQELRNLAHVHEIMHIVHGNQVGYCSNYWFCPFGQSHLLGKHIIDYLGVPAICEKKRKENRKWRLQSFLFS